MKQYITKEQWVEINPEQQKLLITFFTGEEEFEHNIILPNGETAFESKLNLLSIGQMIAFLGEEEFIQSIIWQEYDNPIEAAYGEGKEVESLCDALWGNVKFKLNNYE